MCTVKHEMSETRENHVKTLRKALGKTQQEFAELIKCGYSTLQGYEAGRAIPTDVRRRLVELAVEFRLGNLASEIAGATAPIEQGISLPSTEDRDRIHLTVDAVLDIGDPATVDALRAVLKLCELHITGNPSRAKTAERRGPSI